MCMRVAVAEMTSHLASAPRDASMSFASRRGSTEKGLIVIEVLMDSRCDRGTELEWKQTPALSSADYSDVDTRRQGFVGSRERQWDALLLSVPGLGSYDKH